MDNQTEVILEQMEGTRASLAEKLETLENQVVGTVQNATTTVSETVQQVKEAVTDTVETMKGTVEDTVENVKDTVQGAVESVKETLDVRRQVNEHPWLMFGGAVALGYLAGYVFRGDGPRPLWRGAPWGHAPRQAGPPLGHPSPYDGEQPRYASAPAPRREDETPRQEEPAPQGPSWLQSLSAAVAPELAKVRPMAIGAVLGLVRDAIQRAAPPEVGAHMAEAVNDFTTRVGGQVFKEPILDTFLGEQARRSDSEDVRQGAPAATSYGTAGSRSTF